MDLGDFLIGVIAGIVGGTVAGMCVPEDNKPEWCKKSTPVVGEHINKAKKGVNRLTTYAQEKKVQPILVNTEE